MRHKQIFEGISRAKSLARDAVDTTIAFELTFSEYLTRAFAFYSDEWFKKLPRYAKAEVAGYQQCYYHLKLDTVPGAKVKTFHLYNGILYASFDQWRKAFPNLSGAELTGSCCSAYASGKIFCQYNDKSEHTENVGKTFPIFQEDK